MSVRGSRLLGALTPGLVLALCGTLALADWLQPDPTFRDAQFLLRAALRDTLGHGSDPVRLDTLGVALLRLARFDEAAQVFRHTLELSPRDAAAQAGLGKLALFEGRLVEAESLLTAAFAVARDPEIGNDLYAARLQRRDWTGAAALAADVHEQGRQPLLEAQATRGVYRVTAGPDQVRIPWARSYPVPLVKVKLNGESALMAIDTGTSDLLIDEGWSRRARIQLLPSKSRMFWTGTRLGAGNAIVQRLEVGGITVEDLPAGVMPLRKWSLQVNPQGEAVAGVIGLRFLQAFTPTLDYAGRALVLRRAGQAVTFGPSAQRVPFQIWGEAELTVFGTISGGRRMAMVVQTGVPECGVAAPHQVFEELGLKSGALSRAVGTLGNYLQGRPWTRVSVSAVAIGPIVADKLAGWSGAMDPVEMWRHGVRRDAIVSHDFFAGREVTFDWEGRALVLESRRSRTAAP